MAGPTPVATAFLALPERWQAVLWHADVEQDSPGQIAVLVGLPAAEVPALADQARDGLDREYRQLQSAAGQAEPTGLAAVQARPAGRRGRRAAAASAAAADQAGAASRASAASRRRASQAGAASPASAAADASALAAAVSTALRRDVAPIFLGEATAAYLAARPSPADAGAAGAAAPVLARPVLARLVLARPVLARPVLAAVLGDRRRDQARGPAARRFPEAGGDPGRGRRGAGSHRHRRLPADPQPGRRARLGGGCPRADRFPPGADQRRPRDPSPGRRYGPPTRHRHAQRLTAQRLTAAHRAQRHRLGRPAPHNHRADHRPAPHQQPTTHHGPAH